MFEVNFEELRSFSYRYITVLYFLNDVEEGGETAFPVADNATFSPEVKNKQQTNDNSFFSPKRMCHKVLNFIVKNFPLHSKF